MHTLLYFLFRIVRLVIEAISTIYVSLCRGQLREESPQCEVLRIIGRAKFDPSDPARDCDFILIHEKFAPCNLLLDSKWMLYTVNETHAYFVRLPKDSWCYNVDYAPFVQMKQVAEANLVARVPHADFCKMADGMGEYKGLVVCFSSTLRCGATLLTKMIYASDTSEEHDKVSTLSQPDALTILAAFLEEDRFPTEYFQQLLRAILRAICKDQKTNQVAFFKARSNCVRLAPHVQKVAPQMVQLFMSRKDLEKTVASMFTIGMTSENSLNRAMYLQNIHPALADFMTMWRRREPRLMKVVRPKNALEFTVVLVANAWLDYQKYKQYFTLPVFFYEDLVEKPEETLKPILKECGIAEKSLPRCLECLKDDSQANSVLSRAAAKSSRITLTDEDRKTISDIAKLIQYKAPEN